MSDLKKVRIDKWLWAVRIFKTRTLAADTCKKGKVKVDDEVVKPSFLLKRESMLQVKKEGFNMTYRVVDLLEQRVAAPIAQLCYQDLTPASELNKFKDWFVAEGGTEIRERGSGRPTKKDRREIDTFKDL